MICVGGGPMSKKEIIKRQLKAEFSSEFRKEIKLDKSANAVKSDRIMRASSGIVLVVVLLISILSIGSFKLNSIVSMLILIVYCFIVVYGLIFILYSTLAYILINDKDTKGKDDE